MPTLLTSTGYGNTGSSAVTNILEEFDKVKSFGNVEFTFAHEPDGIADLENSLLEGHRFKTDLAVKRFLKLTHQLSEDNHYKKCFNGNFEKLAGKYINSIISCEWDGFWHRINDTDTITKKQQIKNQVLSEIYTIYLNKNLSYDLYEPDNWKPTYNPLSKEYYSNLHSPKKKNDFLEKTREFTDNLLNEACISENKYKYVLLEQAIPPISFSQYLRYFTSPKVVIVDRDPRDLYIMNKVYWGNGYIPTNNINLFIDWYSQTRQSKENDLTNSNNVINGEALFIPFESLVYEYDDSINKIINYIKLSPNEHTNKLKYFNPDLSIKNTQIFIDYPKLQSDIKLIEQRLEKHCYNFPYIKQKKEVKYIFIDEINQKFNSLKNNKKTPNEIKKYLLNASFKMTKFYRDIHDNNKKRNIFSLIKVCIKLFLCPFEMLFYYNLY